MSWIDSMKKVIARHGGYVQMADVIGRTPEGLRKKLSDADSAHGLQVAEFVTLMEYTGDLSPLYALASQLGCLCYQNRFSEPGDNQELLDRLLAVNSAMGDFTALWQRSLANDGVVDKSEFDVLKSKLIDAQRLQGELLSRIWQIQGDHA